MLDAKKSEYVKGYESYISTGTSLLEKAHDHRDFLLINKTDEIVDLYWIKIGVTTMDVRT